MTLFNLSGQSKTVAVSAPEQAKTAALSAADQAKTAPDTGTALISGKTEADEAFPVAALLARRHRPAVRQFYQCVRRADDVADSAVLPLPEKRRLLSDLRRDAARLPPALVPFAEALIDAFHDDCANPPCRTWEDTLRSARRSSIPVGRMLLVLHDGSDAYAAPAADALCTALQLLNHIGDAGADLQTLGRSILPQDWLDEAGQDPAPVLRRMLSATLPLLTEARPLIRQIRDRRLAFQAAVTLACAHRLAAQISRRTDWRACPHFGVSSFLNALTHGLFLFLRLRWRQ